MTTVKHIETILIKNNEILSDWPFHYVGKAMRKTKHT